MYDYCADFTLPVNIHINVQNIISAFKKSTICRSSPYVIAPRRPGDVARVYADPAKSHRLLGWRAELSLEDMCRDAWNWQSKNPNGYEG